MLLRKGIVTWMDPGFFISSFHKKQHKRHTRMERRGKREEEQERKGGSNVLACTAHHKRLPTSRLVATLNFVVVVIL